jgi:hypothetical protein
VVCHQNATPGIVGQFGHSTMASAKVNCSDCHVVKADYPDATEHEGAYILSSPTPSPKSPFGSTSRYSNKDKERLTLPDKNAIINTACVPTALQNPDTHGMDHEK